jgi:hypothetical protein
MKARQFLALHARRATGETKVVLLHGLDTRQRCELRERLTLAFVPAHRTPPAAQVLEEISRAER